MNHGTTVKLYRYDAVGVSPTRVFLYEYEARETPAGWRLSDGRFVLKKAAKRWATPSIDEAKESFLRRKLKHVVFATSHLAHARAALAMAQAGQLPETVNGSTTNGAEETFVFLNEESPQ